jgi:hypothetical protein
VQPPFDPGDDPPPPIEKEAVVPDGAGGWVALSCLEMPEARFEDLVVAEPPPGARRHAVPLDPVFLAAVDRAGLAVAEAAALAPGGGPLAARVGADRASVVLEAAGILPGRVALRVSAPRLGSAGRFPARTAAQAAANERFWGTPLRGEGAG